MARRDRYSGRGHHQQLYVPLPPQPQGLALWEGNAQKLQDQLNDAIGLKARHPNDFACSSNSNRNHRSGSRIHKNEKLDLRIN